MALNIGELVAYLKADDTKLAAGLEGAKSKLKTFGEGAKAVLATAGAAAAAAIGTGIAQNLDIGAGRAKLAAQLDLSAADSARIGGVAGKVYAGNFGDSLNQVNDAIKAVGNNLGDVTKMSASELQNVTQNALTLASTFDVDVNDATRAAGQLIKTGLAANSQDAFDIITAGFQTGVDKSGDFLDTLNEYSPQFAKLGITGTQALGILQDGLKAGARDTDAIADAFKEFSIRAIDGSTTTAQGFKMLGLDAKTASETIAKGGDGANLMTQKVLQSLLKIKDPVKQNAAGVALFGTQWEDTVRKTLPALAQMSDAQDTVTGATQRMTDAAGNSGAAKIETLKRGVEQWIQSQTSANSVLGTTVAGIAAFGGPAFAMAGTIGQIATGLAAFNAQATWAAITSTAAAIKTGIWTGAQWLLNTALSANPIALVVLAIAALVAIVIVAWKNSETFRSIVIGAWNAIKAAGLAVWGWFGSWVPGVWNSVLSAGRSVFSAIGSVISTVFNAIRNVVSTVIGFVVAYIRVQITIALAIFRGIQAIVGIFTGAFNAARNVVSAVIGFIVNYIRAQIAVALAIIRTVVQVATILGNAFQAGYNAVVGTVGRMIGYVRGIPGQILGALGNLGGLLVGAGRSVIQGLINGIQNMLGSLRSTLSNVTSMIPDWKGPADKDARLLTGNGRLVMRGFIAGLEDEYGGVQRSLTGLTGRLSPSIGVAQIPRPRSGGIGVTPAAVAPRRAEPAEVVFKGDRQVVNFIKGLVRDVSGGDVVKAFGS